MALTKLAAGIKLLAPLGMLGLAFNGCAPVPNHPALSTSTIEAAASMDFPTDDGWQPNERIFPGKPGSDVGPYRQGTTPDGWIYTYYADGSASVDPTRDAVMEGWSIGCFNDAMTDQRKCSVRSTKARLSIVYLGTQVPSWVCIIGHDFPGRRGAIRIDRSEPMLTNEDGCVGGSIAAKLAKGPTFTTRHVEWPYDEALDQQSSSAGLAAALDLLAFLEKKRGKLTF